MFTIGRIAYRREGVFFSIENALSGGKGGWECTARAKYAIYNCLVIYGIVLFLCIAERGRGQRQAIAISVATCLVFQEIIRNQLHQLQV